MWVHAGRLEQVLRPDAYFDPEQHAREVDALFVPGWHFVATTADLARRADEAALELFGRPVCVRNDRGDLRAWVDTRRPEELPVATCGQLVFVSLAEAPPPLAEWLGEPTRALCEALFDGAHRQIARFCIEHAANWKIPIENGVESYHVPRVHPKTFKTMPRAEDVRHDLGDGYTTFEEAGSSSTLGAKLLARALRDAPTHRYMHHHRFPNLTLVSTDLSSYLQVVVPTSPTTSVSHVRSFVHRGDSPGGGRAGPLRRALSAALARPIARFTEGVLAEDGSLFEAVQRGLRASPHAGVLGACEERVHAFQQWVDRRAHRS